MKRELRQANIACLNSSVFKLKDYLLVSSTTDFKTKFDRDIIS